MAEQSSRKFICFDPFKCPKTICKHPKQAADKLFTLNSVHNVVVAKVPKKRRLHVMVMAKIKSDPEKVVEDVKKVLSANKVTFHVGDSHEEWSSKLDGFMELYDNKSVFLVKRVYQLKRRKSPKAEISTSIPLSNVVHQMKRMYNLAEHIMHKFCKNGVDIDESIWSPPEDEVMVSDDDTPEDDKSVDITEDDDHNDECENDQEEDSCDVKKKHKQK